ncbi:GTPase/DUF3482 domain-containing protein [Hydrogenophaga sp.]|uniref:GTPase/DUF3482 domain-containing protein n=1 Tax=Hydrogenophaga sp. TaxID=1904254 RepID=UPI00356145CE
MSAPIQIAVVGHTNAGKTSLLRTLTRQIGFGEVSDRPGTTRHVEHIDLAIDGAPAIRYYDTPGLEDSVALHHHLKSLGDALTPPEKIRTLLRGPEASRAFEQEAKVLRQLLDVDAAIYVIDCREAVLPKYRSEIEILSACGKPVMPVLNFVRSDDSRETQWREVLAAYHLHAVVRFDAVAPFMGSEHQLYEDLGVLIRPRREQLQAVMQELEQQFVDRRAAACRVVADALITAAAMRREIDKSALDEPRVKTRFVQDFKDDLMTGVRRCVSDLLQIHGFRPDDANIAVLPWTSGRWESDLFNPETLATAGKLLGKGAVAGAAVGFALDVALAGMSLGAATALGASIGGVLGQGWGQLPRKLRNKFLAIEELTLGDEVLLVMADNLVRLCEALELRGHAAISSVRLATDSSQAYREALTRAVLQLGQARGHPEWEHRAEQRYLPSRSRQERVAGVEHRLIEVLHECAAPEDIEPPG